MIFLDADGLCELVMEEPASNVRIMYAFNHKDALLIAPVCIGIVREVSALEVEVMATVTFTADEAVASGPTNIYR